MLTRDKGSYFLIFCILLRLLFVSPYLTSVLSFCGFLFVKTSCFNRNPAPSDVTRNLLVLVILFNAAPVKSFGLRPKTTPPISFTNPTAKLIVFATTGFTNLLGCTLVVSPKVFPISLITKGWSNPNLSFFLMSSGSPSFLILK